MRSESACLLPGPTFDVPELHSGTVPAWHDASRGVQLREIRMGFPLLADCCASPRLVGVSDLPFLGLYYIIEPKNGGVE